MALPGLVAAKNLADVADKERTWDNLGLNISANFLLPNLDADASAYLQAVMQADGVGLEPAVQLAVNNFIVGCKTDGTWPAIKASCILAGARTLTGALVPLVGTAPTNVGPFVSGDYNRETGLVGNGSTKYLNSNRNNNADPQNNNHNSAYVTSTGALGGTVIAGGINNTGDNYIDLISTVGGARHTNRNSFNQTDGTYSIGFVGTSRSNSGSYSYRIPGASGDRSIASEAPSSTIVTVFARAAGLSLFSDHRLAFYSIGESLDLALLDARVTDLINAIGAAIP
jgi:hypothetical protein